MKTVNLGVVLSVTDGRLMAPFSDVHEFLEYRAGEPVWTHQLPRVMDEVAPRLLEQFPVLKAAPEDVILHDEATVNAYLDDCIRHGIPATFDVEPLAKDDHTHIHPITELATKLEKK